MIAKMLHIRQITKLKYDDLKQLTDEI